MTHPCNHYSCCENLHGECYGEGCRLNPAPEHGDDSVPFAEDDDNENTQED